MFHFLIICIIIGAIILIPEVRRFIGAIALMAIVGFLAIVAFFGILLMVFSK